MDDVEKILKDLYDTVLEGDEAGAAAAAERSLQAGIPPLTAIEAGLSKGIREVGERFSRGEAFLPEMMMSANSMNRAVEVLSPHFEAAGFEKKGRVLIGTVKGDVHDLGKNIASALLSVNGFAVTDIGRDIPCDRFLDEAERIDADIIGLSALLTTSLPMIQEIISILEEEEVRGDYTLIIGGGPTSQEYADEVGADGYAANAYEGVELCTGLMTRKGA